MAVSNSPRIGVTRWSSGFDPFTRTQMDDSHAAVEAKVAGYLQGTAASRPAAAANLTGFIYHATDTDVTTYCDGAAWVAIDVGATNAVNTHAAATTAHGSTAANTASAIVQRDASGDIFVRLLRSEYTTTTGTPNYFLVQHAVGTGTADNYARPATLAQVKTALGLDPKMTTLGTTGTITVNLALDGVQTTGALTGNITFAASNHLAGRSASVRVVNGTTLRTVTFPAGWRFLGTKPADIPASKIGMLSLIAYGTTDADIVAGWSVEA